MTPGEARLPRVLLISMPWANTDRPAIGISLLKAILAEHGIHAHVRYFNLEWTDLVLERWRAENPTLDVMALPDEDRQMVLQIAENDALFGDWVFSQHLHADAFPDPEPYVDRFLRGRFDEDQIRLRLELRDLVPVFLERCMAAVDWSSYDVVGFTSTFRQHLASLALAKRLKEEQPGKVVIFGGANCEGPMGEALIRSYPFVDYVASGEADRSFPALLRALAEGGDGAGIDGMIRRVDGEPTWTGRPDVIDDLDALPFPDYDDYFREVRETSFAHLLRYRLPVEQARGCWWGARKHCTFCGLNGSSMGYRSKSAERAWDELFALTDRYQVDHVEFTDNILAMGYFKELIPRLAEHDHSVRMFYEVKANLKKEQLHALARAGVYRIQPGIESLSSKVLTRMQKGCTALQNVQCLKWSHQFGIGVQWNLLYGFAGEEPEEYERSLHVLERLTHLDPPGIAIRIRMDRFSPNFERAEELGYVNVRPYLPYTFLFPQQGRALHDLAYFFDYDYADGRDPSAYVAPLREFIAHWRAQPRGSLVYVRAHTGRALIRDTRFNRVAEHFELDRFAARLYERCDSVQRLANLEAAFADDPDRGARDVASLLDRFVDDMIMVREGDQYLAAAPIATATGAADRSRDRADRFVAVLG